MSLALSAFLVGWFALLLGSWLLFSRRRAPPARPLPASPPRVSILIAARNEEAAIARCLQSVRALDYPPECLEVLLGDDASTDRTAEVATAAMQGFAGTFRLLPIRETLGAARGKANVLAHLARAARSDFFLITDADISLPRSWVRSMVGHWQPGLGTVTGLTVVSGPRLFHRLQGLDWLMSLALVQMVSDRGQPVTAMGNNMLVHRAAYEAVGGYESLPFSVTEDYALFQAVLARGFGWRNLFEPAVLAESLPMPSWRGLLHQRRRWLRGVEGLPGPMQAGLVYYAGFYPALALAAWTWGAAAALGIWGAKMLAQALLAGSAYRHVGRRAPLHLLPVFELYTLAVTAGLAGFRLSRRPFEWKGRRYRQ